MNLPRCLSNESNSSFHTALSKACIFKRLNKGQSLRAFPSRAACAVAAQDTAVKSSATDMEKPSRVLEPISPHRDMMLLQMGLDRTRSQVLRQAAKVLDSETNLQASESMLEEDMSRFDAYVDSCAQAALSASRAELEVVAEKQKVYEKVRIVRQEVLELQTRVAGYESERAVLMKLKDFTDGLVASGSLSTAEQANSGECGVSVPFEARDVRKAVGTLNEQNPELAASVETQSESLKRVIADCADERVQHELAEKKAASRLENANAQIALLEQKLTSVTREQASLLETRCELEGSRKALVSLLAALPLGKMSLNGSNPVDEGLQKLCEVLDEADRCFQRAESGIGSTAVLELRLSVTRDSAKSKMRKHK